jgi:ubiquitin C-terminal hydrolase
MWHKYTHIKFNKIVVVFIINMYWLFFGSIFTMIQQSAMQFQQPGRPVGLENPGNACYINASIQSFFCLPQFWSAMNTINNNQQKKDNWYWDVSQNKAGVNNPLNEFIKTYCDSYNANNALPTMISKAIVENAYKNIFKTYSSYLSVDLQSDAAEFLQFFIGIGQKDVFFNEIKQHFPQERSNFKCSKCTHEWKSSPVAAIPVQIQIPLLSSNDVTNLKSCMDGYFGQENNIPDFNCACEEKNQQGQQKCLCAEKGYCSKQITFSNEPQIILIQLKRFCYNQQKQQMTKIKTAMDLPIDYSVTISGKIVPYKLKAIILHHGELADSGHYTAWCSYNGSWYDCNDDKITVINDIATKIQSERQRFVQGSVNTLADDTIQRTAYMLFYEKQ